MFNRRKNKKYRYIFIVDDRNYWQSCASLCDSSVDLVLTYDLGLKKELEHKGIDVLFTDHLISSELMQKHNFLLYKFFQKWHYNKEGEDMFQYKNIPFGLSLRLEFWNDYIEYMRLHINLKELTTVEYIRLYLGTSDKNIEKVLTHISLIFEPIKEMDSDYKSYYFPITKWMDEQIRPNGFKQFKRYIKGKFVSIFMGAMILYDKLSSDKKRVYIHEYHPTVELVSALKRENKVNLLLSNIRKRKSLSEYRNERYIPISGSDKAFESISKSLMIKVKEEKVATLILEDGENVTDIAYRLILERVSTRLASRLKILDSIIKFTDKVSIDLVVLIANIGELSTLLHCVCKTKGIPSFLIINGLLGPEYSDESKDATTINAYSNSIEKYYFKGMDNILTLGDPRMDKYSETEKKLHLNREEPTIVIGASGFNSVDLNSYVAVEFDFMYEVLIAMREIKERGNIIKVILKIRPNGYRQQYEEFVEEYFPDIVDKIEDTIPMKEVLIKADFYITIYSQTLFEASCLGIPAVYYKKDTEVMNPPFNGSSELVTVYNSDALIQSFDDFKDNTTRYDAFLDRNIMEKYVGPLDGNNLERNRDYIYNVLSIG